MNKYTLLIANTEMEVSGYNEYSAMMDIGLFEKAEIKNYIRGKNDTDNWIYLITLNGKRQIAYITKS